MPGLAEHVVRTEEHRVCGERLLARIRELVREGNARRIIIKNDEGRVLLEIPLTIGAVGAELVPIWAAVGAIAAFAADFILVIERDVEVSCGTSS